MLSKSQSVEELRYATNSDSLSLTLFPDPPAERSISEPDNGRRTPSPDAQASGSSSPTSSQYQTDTFPSPTQDSITSPGSSLNVISPLNDSYFFQGKKGDDVDITHSPTNPSLLHLHNRRQRFIRSPSPVSPHSRFSSPDRFLPIREPHTSEVSPFRLNKNPRLLSPGEKLLRRQDPRADPFAPYQPRRRVVGSRSSRSLDRRDTPHHLPRHVSDTSVYARNDRSAGSRNQRQISAGAVWSVGGTFAATGSAPVGVQDGHGGLLSTGSSAPMYVANFLDKDTHAQHLKRHEARLAAALDIDQATKVLNFGDTASHTEHIHTTGDSLHAQYPSYVWKNSSWVRADTSTPKKSVCKPKRDAVPSTPFRVLDAPLLRDDFYCSTLAYSYTARMLAVGLSSRVYLWSELLGVQYPPLTPHLASNYVTSLSFSSPQGGNSILAVGRHGGQVSLWSTFDTVVRFEFYQPNSVSCVSFKQTPTKRHSARFQGSLVDTEDLVVGDDAGIVWYYSVEWTDPKSRELHGWNGSTTLIAKISAHTQQICGLVWSPDGKYLATGGNDNACLLFDISDVLGKEDERGQLNSPGQASDQPTSSQARSNLPRFPYRSQLNRIFDWSHINQLALPISLAGGASRGTRSHSPSNRTSNSISGQSQAIFVPANRQKYKFPHSAAVKAIAFAPWQPSLLATGGGSNDRCIHFYHTGSGACLATINVHAQVTSLIWSKTRREIAATFGYAQPEHPFRVAVFAWPSCQQVVAIPWTPSSDGGPGSTDSDNSFDCGRALWAISYPGGPNDTSYVGGDDRMPSTSSTNSTIRPAAPGVTVGGDSNRPVSPGSGMTPVTTESSPITRPRAAYKEGGTWWSRTAEEGCIIVASSDECVKFHEVWSGTRKSTTGTTGQLGGSAILESLEGIDWEGSEIIR
ncbi:hypothetical protein PABG_03099 [Paracoccidioides brasiliensis Pb03]|nr:hypothetical protein PABG_03099 [Paracoccidioides brasiliensis Pb03]